MERLTYFLISRKLFDSAIWRENPHNLKLFIYLIGMARHDKKPKRYPGFKIERGELVTSLSDLVENNEYFENGVMKRWSRAKAARMLNNLRDSGYIEKKPDTYGTHIRICNYDRYQSPETYRSDTGETHPRRTRDAPETQVRTYNNGNNDKNGKKGYIPENFSIDENMRSYALKKDIDPDKVDELFESFIAYHVNNKTKAVLWDRSWQTWVRNAPEFSKWSMRKPGPKTVSSKTENNLAILKGGRDEE